MSAKSPPPKILVVEDEAIIGLDIKRLLSAAGYAIAGVAATSEQAIRAAETTNPDLVLMDIHLKGSKDGIDTAQYIRQSYNLPVVFVTAHADRATLERARETEPFGYIVKPISALSLTSTVEMALHKHRIERQLEEHRAWLGTVLQTIPDAVVVSDLSGRVQFLNSAAGQLLGAVQGNVLGELVDDVLPLASGERVNLASQAIERAEWGNRVSLPKDTFLRANHGGRNISVEGDVAVSYIGDLPAGVVFTLRDISRREQEESIERQEERMLALGRLANTIAHDFNSLHTLLGACCNDLSTLADSLEGDERSFLLDKVDTVARVNSIGLLMTEQLITLSEQPKVRATLVSASGVVASVEPLLTKLSTGSIQLDIHLTDQSTLVLCHPDRLSLLLVNVFLNARERMCSAGRIRVSTDQKGANRVAIVFDIEHIGNSAVRSLSFPMEMENPDFSLSIAHALVAAMEGSISFTPVSEKQGRIEILLPRQHAEQDLIDLKNRRGNVLLIGADLELLEMLEDWLWKQRFGVIRCSSPAEALLLGQLYDNKVDWVICEAEVAASISSRKLRTFFLNRNAATRFVRLGEEEQFPEAGWEALSRLPSASVLESLARLLGVGSRRMSAHR